jgi:hypothetical protein
MLKLKLFFLFSARLLLMAKMGIVIAMVLCFVYMEQSVIIEPIACQLQVVVDYFGWRIVPDNVLDHKGKYLIRPAVKIQ